MGYFKINFDGSVKRGKVTTGYKIIYYYTGNLIRVRVIKLGNESVFVVEITVLRNGV